MILVKAGGGASLNWEGIALDLAELHQSVPLILVHGANALRNEIAGRLGIALRTVVSPSGVTSVYTDREALDVFLMAYAGLANKRIVALLQRHGLQAVGLSGVDGRLWEAKAKKDLLVKDNGRTKLLRNNLTGRVERINTGLLGLLLFQHLGRGSVGYLGFAHHDGFGGGRVVVTVAALPYKCPAAPYEAALLLDDELRRRGLRARSEIERGAGPEAIDEAIQQIARAAGILKGSAVADAVLQLLKVPH